MATLRLLRALQRATYVTQGFGQCRVARELGVYQCREFSNHNTVSFDDEDAATKSKQSPKTAVPKITLLLPDNSMSVTNLENAERLAKRRKFSLIKVSDPDSKTQRATYKLVNNLIKNTEVLQDDRSDIHKSKDIKLFYISAVITKHDLLVKIKNVVKMLNKGNKIKISITLNDKEDDKVDTITEMVKDVGNIQKLQSKKKLALLLITPLDKKDENKSTNNKEATAAPNTIIETSNT